MPGKISKALNSLRNTPLAASIQSQIGPAALKQKRVERQAELRAGSALLKPASASKVEAGGLRYARAQSLRDGAAMATAFEQNAAAQKLAAVRQRLGGTKLTAEGIFTLTNVAAQATGRGMSVAMVKEVATKVSFSSARDALEALGRAYGPARSSGVFEDMMAAWNGHNEADAASVVARLAANIERVSIEKGLSKDSASVLGEATKLLGARVLKSLSWSAKDDNYSIGGEAAYEKTGRPIGAMGRVKETLERAALKGQRSELLVEQAVRRAAAATLDRFVLPGMEKAAVHAAVDAPAVLKGLAIGVAAPVGLALAPVAALGGATFGLARPVAKRAAEGTKIGSEVAMNSLKKSARTLARAGKSASRAIGAAAKEGVGDAFGLVGIKQLAGDEPPASVGRANISPLTSAAVSVSESAMDSTDSAGAVEQGFVRLTSIVR